MNPSTQQCVNITSHAALKRNTLFSQSNLKKLNLLGVIALMVSIGCTPPCRFNEEENCTPGTEMPGGEEVIIGGEIGGNGIIPSDNLEPKTVDLLVIASFDQSLIGEYYGNIIDSVIIQLSRYQINVAHAAIAPMYRRLNTDTPLLYGTPDEESEFNSYNEAFEYFSSEEGLLPLDNQTDLDGQNLLQIGARLGTSAVYHPRLGSEGSRYLYRTPQDGMLIVWINPFQRRCQLNDCVGSAGNLSSKLTTANEQGEAEWLSLGGQGRLPLSKIVHAFIGTEETTNENGFFDRCANRVGLPARILDHIEPSPIELYTKLDRYLKDEGLASHRVDFCQAVSDEGFDALEVIANKLRQQVR